ncbi:hypothetical protein PQO03_19685 [Lentisphaera profundi]|uniref:Metallothionein n=1 Tax=Lentisphaera profundi TaxID=1658616 RepID=A0ABY7VUZ9_9BACT|nr:hypothetical protein [Lentisphaera profundi]WDE98045.1 hypothetical protein PQO03_19685 [Lentisphaera profundi]
MKKIIIVAAVLLSVWGCSSSESSCTCPGSSGACECTGGTCECGTCEVK